MRKRYLWLLPLLTAILILCLACSPDQPTEDSKTGNQTDSEARQDPEAEVIEIVTPAPDLHREELDAILKRSTMLEGVTINGVSVGGMTMEQAKAAVLPALEEAKKNTIVTVTLGEKEQPFSGEAIALTDNLDEILREAFALVREDKGFDAVSHEVEAIKSNGMAYSVRIGFDEAALRTAVDLYASANDTQPVDATVAYNKEKNVIDFSPDIPGLTIDRDALVSALLSAVL